MFFMPGDAVLFDQVDKIARGVGGQRRAAKIRILRQKISRPRADIGEVAAPTPRDADFLGQALRMFHDDHTHPTPTCDGRSEEHTSELQSLMRISYAVFCLKKKHT